MSAITPHVRIPRWPRRAEVEPGATISAPGPGALEAVPQRLPDPSKPAEARGSWEQAALVNVGITELVKQQLNAQTPPWKK